MLFQSLPYTKYNSSLLFPRRLKYVKFTFGFRERWQYNNLMYALAARVAEKLDGKIWEDLLQEHILAPLGMNNTYFLHRESNDTNNFAQPYVYIPEVGSVHIEIESMR